MLWRHLNFRQISHRFTSSFVNPSFPYLNDTHIMYWNMIILNPSRFKVEPHSKYWYFCIERWDLLSLRFSENAVLFHIEWVCRKTAGNLNRPPYRYIAVTHWAWLPSSVEMLLIPNALCWSSRMCNCACALPAEVQLRLRVTRRSWQKLFAGKNFGDCADAVAFIQWTTEGVWK